MNDKEYREAIDLCRAVVDAAESDDGGPMVAGSFLGKLRTLLNADGDPVSALTAQEATP